MKAMPCKSIPTAEKYESLKADRDRLAGELEQAKATIDTLIKVFPILKEQLAQVTVYCGIALDIERALETPPSRYEEKLNKLLAALDEIAGDPLCFASKSCEKIARAALKEWIEK